MKFNALSITIKNHKGEIYTEHVFENNYECLALEELVQEVIFHSYTELNFEELNFDAAFAKAKTFLEDITACAEAMRFKTTTTNGRSRYEQAKN